MRIAFCMSVHPGFEDEYRKRHDPIWPELEETLKGHGVLDYSIFLLPETRQLFAVAEIESRERWEAIASTEVCRRWWMHMEPLMPCNPDRSPVSTPMIEVFRLA